MEKKCETCGKAFEIKPYLAEIRKHCSAECKHQANRVTLTCKTCRKTWQTWKSQIKIHDRPGAGQFCSKPCADLAKRIPKPEKPPRKLPSEIFKTCEVCEKTFRVYPQRKDTARFCSKVCLSKSDAYKVECSERQKGSKSWRWTGAAIKDGVGYVVSKGVGKKRPGYEHTKIMLDWILEDAPSHPFIISKDGVKKLHPSLDVHHIDRSRSNNSRDNLLIVTKSAHAKIHHKVNSKPEPWECWPSNPKRW